MTRFKGGLLAGLTALMLLGACKEETEAKAPASNPSGPRAIVSLDLLEIRHEMVEGRHRYVHRRVFTESAGVASTIRRGKVCVQNGTECVDALTNYALPAMGTFIQPNSHFATPLEKDRVTLQYWIADANGHELQVMVTVDTDGDSATVTKQ